MKKIEELLKKLEEADNAATLKIVEILGEEIKKRDEEIKRIKKELAEWQNTACLAGIVGL